MNVLPLPTLYRAVVAAASAVTGAAAYAVTVASSDPSAVAAVAAVAAASAVTVAASADIHCSDRSYFVAVAPILGQIPGQMLLTI